MENECGAYTIIKAGPCASWGSQHYVHTFAGKIFFACKGVLFFQVKKILMLLHERLCSLRVRQDRQKATLWRKLYISFPQARLCRSLLQGKGFTSCQFSCCIFSLARKNVWVFPFFPPSFCCISPMYQMYLWPQTWLIWWFVLYVNTLLFSASVCIIQAVGRPDYINCIR